jgi:hypothetical protein
LDAPAADIWTLPVYVPALGFAGETDKETVDGAAPEVGDTLSQDVPVLAVQVSVPPPPFVIWIDCAPGMALPTV